MTKTQTLFLACALLIACGEDERTSDTTEDPAAASAEGASEAVEESGVEAGAVLTSDDADDAPRVGFEIMQMVSMNEIVVWIGDGVTAEDFDALELPVGWGFKNQPREGVADASRFLRSPDASAEGEFVDAEHFGLNWRHNATVLEANVRLDDAGLLRRNTVAKVHEVTYRAGRTLPFLISPEGDTFVLISRDPARTVEEPTIPEPWEVIELTLEGDVTIVLPDPTWNIRCDNEDSFQGPIDPAAFGL